MEWSPGNEWLASGSKEGLLHIWDGDIAGIKTSYKPITTIKQPTAAKVTSVKMKLDNKTCLFTVAQIVYLLHYPSRLYYYILLYITVVFLSVC